MPTENGTIRVERASAPAKNGDNWSGAGLRARKHACSTIQAVPRPTLCAPRGSHTMRSSVGFIPFYRRAATQAETLVAMLFVCLLATFLATGMTENRERAQRARCLADLREP